MLSGSRTGVSVVAACWTILGIALAVFLRLQSDASPVWLLVAVAVAGATVGTLFGFIHSRLQRLAPRSAAGATIGHLLAVPPAVQLGQLGGGVLANAVITHGQAASLAAYWGAAVLSAAAIAILGSLLGVLAESGLRAAYGRIGLRAPIGLLRWLVRRVPFVALVAGVLFYFDSRWSLPWPGAQPPAVSAWIQRETSQFRALMSTQRHDVFILPVQADGPSFDRIARSLMTRYLVRSVSERTGTAVADPTLLARAFDARARRIELADAQRLAEVQGARRLLVSEVRRSRETFTFVVRLWTREGAGAWQEATPAVLKEVPFNDRLPPSVAFRNVVDSLVDQLKLGERKPAPPAAGDSGGESYPIEDLLKLTRLDRAPAIDRALHLQWLASLHERDSLEAQTLWERSLIALPAAPDAPLHRVLEARAYMHLARRPYALQVLGDPASPPGRALLAALNGDVPGLEATVGAIEHPLLKLLSEIELVDLYRIYDMDAKMKARRSAVLASIVQAPLALELRLPSGEWFMAQAHARIADALRFEQPRRAYWRDQASAWAHWLYWIPDSLAQHELRLARSVEQRYLPLWRVRGAEWVGRPAGDRLAEWDYFELLFALNRTALVQTFRSMVQSQDLPQQAAATIEALGDEFVGHPYLTYFHASALDRWGRKQAPGSGAERRLYSRSSALAVATYQWEQGESDISSSAEHYIYEREFEKYDDEPPRWYRTNVPKSRLFLDPLSYTPQQMEREAAKAQRSLTFSDRNVGPLNDQLRWLRRAGRVEEALAIVREHDHRFIGAPGREEIVKWMADTEKDPANLLALYRRRLDADPENWDRRWELALAHVDAGRHADAQRLLLEYPAFARRDPDDRVRLANLAHEAGSLMHRLGEQALAEPLLKLSVGMQTGSAREMRSREFLALNSNDVEGALRQVAHQIERYNDSAAATRDVVFRYLLGRKEEAWARLEEYLMRFDNNEEVWTAALLLHRMEQTGGAAVEAWLARVAAGDRRKDYMSKALRERYAFLHAFTDRKPSAAAIDQVRRVADANNRSRWYPDIAEGYLALHGNDFPQAAKKLRGPHADLYNLAVNRRESISELLPYLTWAYVRAGNAEEASKLLEAHRLNIGADSDYLVARALFDGAAGNHAQAVVSLRRASYRLAPLRARSFFPGFVLLEGCEWLFQASRYEPYRELIEDLARRSQIVLPYPWATTFEAGYAADADARRIAAGAAVILDPQSPRIAGIQQAEREGMRGAAVRHGSVLGAVLRQRR